MNSGKKGFLKTSAYAVFSQVVSLCCGLITSLLLPKILGIEQFGYWQYFFLCGSYIGLLHFGFNDGVYLKLGGTSFSDIDKAEYYPQLLLVSFFQIMIAIGLAVYSYLLARDAYQIVFYFLAIYIIFENIYKLLSFVLMATDKMRYYSQTVMLDKVVFLVLLFAFLFLLRQLTFESVIIANLSARFLALMFVVSRFGSIFDLKFISRAITPKCLKNVMQNMAMGISLTISNLLSTFIIGSGRFFVEHHWGISVFAKISFAVSLSMFVLSFISQIGLVLFSYLCRMDRERQRVLLDMLTFIVGVFALSCFIGFVPLSFIVKLWIPKYIESLGYLMMLCPIALFETRMVLIFGTYFKTFRKQVVLLKINLVSVIFAIACYYFSSSIVNSVNMVVLSMLVSIMFRSYLCQYYLYRYLHVRMDKVVIIVEVMASAIMILAYSQFNSMLLFVLSYALSLLALVLLRLGKIKRCYSLIKA